MSIERWTFWTAYTLVAVLAGLILAKIIGG